MNIRRFILRVAVGLLAFLIGIAVTWALVGLNPFQGSSRSYRKHCGHYRSWSASPAERSEYAVGPGAVFPEEGRSYKTKRMFRAIPPPPPPPAPVAPVD